MKKLILFSGLILFLSACGAKKGAQATSEVGMKTDGEMGKFQSVYFEGQREKAIENYDKAYQKFQECAQLSPQEDAVFYELAKLDTLSDNYSSSLSHVIKAIQIDPNNLWYARLKADVEVELGMLDDALVTLKSIQKRAPEDIKYLDKLASLATYKEEFKTALMAYNAIEKEVGSNEDLTRQKYYLFLDQGKEEEALNELIKLSKKYPENENYVRNIASHHMENGDTAEALVIYENLSELNALDGNTQLALAEIYSSLGQSEKSNQALSAGFLDPNAPLEKKIKLLFAIIQSNDEKVDVDLLITHLEETHPERGETWSISGDWAEMSADPEKALRSYKKALEIDPNYKVLWEKVNQMAWLASDHDELMSLSTKALSLYPLESGFYFFQGQAYLGLKEFEKAINAFKTGKDFTLDDVAATLKFQIALAKSHFSLQEFDLAQNWLLESMEVGGSSSGEALELFGDCLFKLGKTADAVENWKKAKKYSGTSELIDRKIADEQYMAE